MPTNKILRLLLALMALVFAALACQIGGPPAIGEVVVAKELDADYKPVNPTDSYNTNETTVNVSVEVKNIEVGNVVEVKFKVDGADYDQIALTADQAGSGYYGFTLTNPDGHTPGDYVAEVYLNGEFVKSVNFKIIPSGPPSLGNIVSAKKLDEANKPLEPATVFAPSDVVYISVQVRDFVPGSQVTVKYYYEGEFAELENTLTAEEKGSGYFGFTLTPSAEGFPKGNYSAEVYLDGTLINTISFSVQ